MGYLFAIAVTLALLQSEPAWGSEGRGPKAIEGVVNLNAATTEELQMLPGVGPSKVRNIVAYRAKHPFRTVEELARIKGIGRRMVRKLRPHLAVNGPTTARALRLAPGTLPPAAPPPQPPPKPIGPVRPSPSIGGAVRARPLAKARTGSSPAQRPTERSDPLLDSPANQCLAPP